MSTPKYWVLKMTFYNSETGQITDSGKYWNTIPETEHEFKKRAKRAMKKEKKPFCWQIKSVRQPRVS